MFHLVFGRERQIDVCALVLRVLVNATCYTLVTIGCSSYFRRRRMFFSSRLCTRPVLVRLRFRFLCFFVRMWLWNACLRFTLPVPVSLNRFFAPDLVFIFGMTALCFWA